MQKKQQALNASSGSIVEQREDAPASESCQKGRCMPMSGVMEVRA